MNPLDATIVRLGVYIGQLETQVQELYRQLREKTKEFDEYKNRDAALVTMPPQPAVST